MKQNGLSSAAMLLWGLQFSFLNPALAFLLVDLFDADAPTVGGVLALYNLSGVVGSLTIANIADRRRGYVSGVVISGAAALALALVLFFSTSLLVVVIALALFGGPAAGGVPLLFAHLRAAGGRPADVVRARALFSLAWVAGPPLATFVISAFGTRAELGVIAAIASLNVAIGILMLRSRVTYADSPARDQRLGGTDTRSGAGSATRSTVVVTVVAFVFLQAGNHAAVTSMTLFTTRSLGLGIEWAGVALGVSAALEIGALLLIARLTERFSSTVLVVQGCIVGVVYFACMTFLVSSPVELIAAQVLNAWFFASLEGVGLNLFQQIIERPGIASSLFTNTVQLGGVAAGPLIAIAGASALGYRGVFAAAGVLTLVGVALTGVTALRPQRRRSRVQGEEPNGPG